MTDIDFWPFEQDADRGDPLTALRIAVTGSHSHWCYIVAFDRESPMRPTDVEASMLASALEEYKHHWYNATYLDKLGRRALDVDGGANGMTFHKYADSDWAYRRRSWTRGPWLIPMPREARERYRAKGDQVMGPLTLAELLDHIHTIADVKPMQRWIDWKAAHPDVFPA
jgi:hypothetical protein